MVQDSVCASGLEIKQVQVGQGPLPGEREGFDISLFTVIHPDPADLAFFPTGRLCVCSPRDSHSHKLTMAGGKFSIRNLRMQHFKQASHLYEKCPEQ